LTVGKRIWGENSMGYVNTQVTLKNIRDVLNAKEGNLPEDKIRQATIDVMVDTGASMLVINENLFQQLGLNSIGESEITLANEAKETCKVTEPLMISWEDRFTPYARAGNKRRAGFFTGRPSP
jgi:hypothetical protein